MKREEGGWGGGCGGIIEDEDEDEDVSSSSLYNLNLLWTLKGRKLSEKDKFSKVLIWFSKQLID